MSLTSGSASISQPRPSSARCRCPTPGSSSPSAVSAAGDQVGSKPVGTGPFKLGEWKRGTSITLVRNPDYKWGTPEVENKGPVHVDKLVYKVIPDATTQVSAVQSGDVDITFVNDPSQLATLEKAPGVRVERVNMDALIFLGYNCAKPPFDDVRVRQALNYAVNKDEIIGTALGGLGAVAKTPLTPGSLGYDASLGQYGQSYDVAKARSLLAEAGFKQGADGTWERDGKKLGGKLLTSNRAPNDAIATVIQSELKAIGVTVEIQQLDSAAVQKATTEGSLRPAALAIRVERPRRPQRLPLDEPDPADQPGLLLQQAGRRASRPGAARARSPEAWAVLRRGAEANPRRRSLAASLQPRRGHGRPRPSERPQGRSDGPDAPQRRHAEDVAMSDDIVRVDIARDNKARDVIARVAFVRGS